MKALDTLAAVWLILFFGSVFQALAWIIPHDGLIASIGLAVIWAFVGLVTIISIKRMFK